MNKSRDRVRAPPSVPPLTSISHWLVPIATEERRYTTDVEGKAKDNAVKAKRASISGSGMIYLNQPSSLMTSAAFTRSQRLGEPPLCTCTRIGWHSGSTIAVSSAGSGRNTPFLTPLCRSAARGANKRSKQQITEWDSGLLFRPSWQV